MIIKTPGKISIMVGGNVVGVAESAKLTVAEDEGSTKECSDPWRTPYPTKSWDITGKAILQKPSDVLRGLLGDKQKFDVTIGQEIGKLPRKMKKALHSKRMSKWKQRVEEYINRRQIHLHDVAIEVESVPPIRWEARRDSAISAYINRPIY